MASTTTEPVPHDPSRVRPTRRTPRTDLDLVEALEIAEGWSTGGYSENSMAYWRGMRDTLRVLLGITENPPYDSTDDAAATTLLRGVPPR
jgi:hypothetical protein